MSLIVLKKYYLIWYIDGSYSNIDDVRNFLHNHDYCKLLQNDAVLYFKVIETDSENNQCLTDVYDYVNSLN